MVLQESKQQMKIVLTKIPNSFPQHQNITKSKILTLKIIIPDYNASHFLPYHSQTFETSLNLSSKTVK